MNYAMRLGFVILAYGRYRGVGDHGYHRHGGGRRGGYVKTHSKHKSSFNMAHSHEHGEETFRRLKRAMFPNE